MQKYQHLYKANTTTSHYLLSKVFRAKERIDDEFPDQATEWKNVHGDSTEVAREAAKAASAAKEAGAKATGGGGTSDTSDSASKS